MRRDEAERDEMPKRMKKRIEDDGCWGSVPSVLSAKPAYLVLSISKAVCFYVTDHRTGQRDVELSRKG
jgi:hypothetical protein